MKPYFIVFFICLLFICDVSYAQKNDDDLLFGTTKQVESHKGWLISANGNFDVPGADMAKDFGSSYRIGPSVLYKTTSNWIFGVKTDFIFGNKVHTDSLMINIKDKYGDYILENGARETLTIDERGYMIGIQVGKIVGIGQRKKSKDNGILFMTSLGFIQHKILINNPDGVPALNGNYIKGYDRLTNGLFAEESIEYTYISKYKLLNFHIGPDIMFASTQDRRDYLFDVMRSDNKQRLDILFGIRGGWYLPIFKRKSEELVF
jgi:hypothetical protein